MNDFELRRRLAQLPAEREPAHELWPGIAARIAVQVGSGKRRPRSWHWLALAASALLAAVLVVAPQRGGDPGVGGQDLARSLLLLEAEALAAEYEGALREFGPLDLPPELRGVVEELDRDLAALHAAIRAEPEAGFLLDHLRRAYTQRLRLSQRLVMG
jgi:hypothetical protein